MTSTGYFGLKDVKVARWQSATSWTQPEVDVLGARVFGLNEELVSATHEGDDRRITVHSQAIGAQVELEFLFSDISLYATLTGRTVATSGADRTLVLDPSNFPYFGIAGIISAAEGETETLELFLPKVKLTESFQIQAQYGQLIVPRVRATVVYNSVAYGFGMLIERAALETTVSIPPDYNAP